MPTQAFKGGWKFRRGDAASGSTVWTDVGEIISMSGLGATADDVDVTNTDSGNTREYIAGLLDGAEITIEANLLVALNQAQRDMTDNSLNGVNWEFQVELTDGTSTLTIDFIGSNKGVVFNPSLEEQNKIQWTVKISSVLVPVYS